MTEQEWTNAPDPQMLLEFIGERVSRRKIRLFAIACCRTMGGLLGSSQQYALHIAEKHADSEATDSDLEAALMGVLRDQRSQWRIGPESIERHMIRGVHAALYSDSIKELYSSPEKMFGESPFVPYATEAFKVPYAYSLFASIHVAHAVAAYTHSNERTAGPQEDLLRQVFALHAHLLRDVVGNPFQDSATAIAKIARANPQIKLLAVQIYLNSAFFMVPILADLLVENGMRVSSIKEQVGPESHHVKGCWLVDQVLGLD
jgi:hypothetical protein